MKKCISCLDNKPVDDFYKKKSGKAISECKDCNKQRISDVRRRIKSILVKEFGGKCMLCGYNKSIRALQFHHKNPKDKSFGISTGNIKSLKRVREEAQKCVLLCSNCHAEVEDGITKL